MAAGDKFHYDHDGGYFWLSPTAYATTTSTASTSTLPEDYFVEASEMVGETMAAPPTVSKELEGIFAELLVVLDDYFQEIKNELEEIREYVKPDPVVKKTTTTDSPSSSPSVSPSASMWKRAAERASEGLEGLRWSKDTKK